VVRNRNNSEFDKIDSEILITGEDNEYEIEECSIFDQGVDEKKTYQCLFRKGNLLRKQRVTKKKKQAKGFRTTVKQTTSPLSLQGYSA